VHTCRFGVPGNVSAHGSSQSRIRTGLQDDRALESSKVTSGQVKASLQWNPLSGPVFESRAPATNWMVVFGRCRGSASVVIRVAASTITPLLRQGTPDIFGKQCYRNA
jgi:hypothetical protein